MAEINRRLQEVKAHANYTFLQGKEEFENSDAHLANPSTIDEELQYQHQIFSRLRFAYSEQETRDKFLRKMSEMTSINDIDDLDLQAIEAERSRKKASLKQNKVELEAQIARSEEITRENILLYKQYGEKAKRAQDLLQSIQDLEAQIDNAMAYEESTLSQTEYNEIFNNINPSGESEIEQIIKNSKEQLENLQAEVNEVEAATDDKSKLVSELRDQNEQIEKQLVQIRSTPRDEAPSGLLQDQCRWLELLSEIILKFTNVVDFNVDKCGDDYKLMVYFENKCGEIIYTKDLMVKENDEWIKCENVEKFWKVITMKVNAIESSGI